MLKLTIPTSATLVSPAARPSLEPAEAVIGNLVKTGGLSESVGASYISALKSLARRMNTPLGHLSMTVDGFDERFPEDGFEPEHNRSNKGYEVWRRRTRAALGHLEGRHAARAAERAVRDGWTDLAAALEPFTKDRPARWKLAPQKRIAILSTLAPAARKRDRQPWEITLSVAAEMDRELQGNARTSLRGGLDTLDRVRDFPGLSRLLPPQPVGFTPDVRRSLRRGLPEAWEEEVQGWIRQTTRGDWDPVGETFTGAHVKHAHVARSAFRTFLAVALEVGAIERSAASVSAMFACGEAMRAVCRGMYRLPERPKGRGRVKQTTVRKYLKLIRQVLAVRGLDTALLSETLRNNREMRQAAKAERRMTDKNRKFCEPLVCKRHLRRRFLRSFRTLREAAERIAARAGAEGREMTAREIARLRVLGACAAFAALEIGGAPIRIDNALQITVTGADAWLKVPEKGTGPMQVKIPPEATKCGREIAFPIRRNRHGAYDTLRWYLREIRPLFPHAATSRFLFPAVTRPGIPFAHQRFRAEFSNAMREIADLPMTPHQMRHGQESLLYHRFPEEIETIAARGDHEVETFRRRYLWIDTRRLVARGQDMMMELMDADA